MTRLPVCSRRLPRVQGATRAVRSLTWPRVVPGTGTGGQVTPRSLRGPTILLIIWGLWQARSPTVLDLRGFKIWSYNSQLGSLRAGPCFWGAPSRVPASMLIKAQATRKGHREVLRPIASAGGMAGP